MAPSDRFSAGTLLSTRPVLFCGSCAADLEDFGASNALRLFMYAAPAALALLDRASEGAATPGPGSPPLRCRAYFCKFTGRRNQLLTALHPVAKWKRGIAEMMWKQQSPRALYACVCASSATY